MQAITIKTGKQILTLEEVILLDPREGILEYLISQGHDVVLQDVEQKWIVKEGNK